MTDSVAELLKDECVVYILVDADTVTPRITGNKTRPLLQPNPVSGGPKFLGAAAADTKSWRTSLWTHEAAAPSPR